MTGHNLLRNFALEFCTGEYLCEMSTKPNVLLILSVDLEQLYVSLVYCISGLQIHECYILCHVFQYQYVISYVMPSSNSMLFCMSWPQELVCYIVFQVLQKQYVILYVMSQNTCMLHCMSVPQILVCYIVFHVL